MIEYEHGCKNIQRSYIEKMVGMREDGTRKTLVPFALHGRRLCMRNGNSEHSIRNTKNRDRAVFFVREEVMIFLMHNKTFALHNGRIRILLPLSGQEDIVLVLNIFCIRAPYPRSSLKERKSQCGLKYIPQERKTGLQKGAFSKIFAWVLLWNIA